MVLLRPVTTINDKNGPFSVDGAKFSRSDQTSFCRRYVIKTINFIQQTKDRDDSIETIQTTISDTITNLYEKDGLILIGGFQSSETTLDLVLFKEDVGTKIAGNEIEINILHFEDSQWGKDDSQRSYIEDSIENE